MKLFEKIRTFVFGEPILSGAVVGSNSKMEWKNSYNISIMAADADSFRRMIKENPEAIRAIVRSNLKHPPEAA